MTKKFCVEVKDKQGVFDAVAESLKRDIADLGILKPVDVEYVRVYSLRSRNTLNTIKNFASQVLSDPVSQENRVNDNFFPSGSSGVYVVEVAYNPGVMDPVEQSLLKAARDVGVEMESAHTSHKYILKGKLSPEEVESITQKLLCNKTVQHVVKKTEEVYDQEDYVFFYEQVGLCSVSDRELLRISEEGKLFLTLEEMRAIRSHFIEIGRDPSQCELETLAQTWSEHCKHKTMMGRISLDGEVFDNLLKQTIMKATKELNLPWCVSVFKDNAGIIKFDEDYNICFKVETHNHPTALEPYGGAETGIGGVIRDTLGTGRGARPVMNTDIFCLGYPDMSYKKLPKGCLHPKRVLKGVVSGVRDYGNKMGIPTVNGAVCFDDRYSGNPLVFCGNVGIMPKEYSEKKVSPGDMIVLAGGRTGRDGIHGATFSSGELTSVSEETFSTAVQIGNPITEKQIVDTLLSARAEDLYESVTDCGAGGLSSAVGEMGEKTGAKVYLDKVPLKYRGLKPWEIWISEAQERMVFAVRPEKVDRLLEVFKKENVEATVIGSFTDTSKLELFYEGNRIADLAMDFLHDGVPDIEKKAVLAKPCEGTKNLPEEPKDLTLALKRTLSTWNVASKEWIIRQYDHEVQGGSVLKPLVGEKNDGPSDAAISRPLLGSNRGIVLGCGICPDFSVGDPYHMAASAIEEALRQIVAVGGDIERTALLDNFCWGSSEDPEQLGAMVRACQACYDMAKAYRTPFISGKDSLNNEFNSGDKTLSIPPTLLISAVSVVKDVCRTISMDIKNPGNLVFVVGRTYNELGGSQYLKGLLLSGGVVPELRLNESLSILKNLSEAISEGLVESAHDCSEGGLGVSLSEMLFSGGLGAEITLEELPRSLDLERDDSALFSESNSRFVVEVSPEKHSAFLEKMKHVPVGCIGQTHKDTKFTIRSMAGRSIVQTDIYSLKEAWQRPFRELMHEGS